MIEPLEGQMESQTEVHGCILYDGACGACTYFVGQRASFFEKHGFKVAAIQEGWVEDRFPGQREYLENEIHLLLPNGKMRKGADVYREVWKRVWWLTPLYLISTIPFISRFVDYLYSVFARRRRKISQVCGLDSKARYER